MLGYLRDLSKTAPPWVLEEFKRFPDLARQEELIAVLRDPKKRISDKAWNAILKYERKRLVKAEGSKAGDRSLLLPLGRFLSRGMKDFDGEAKLTIKERRKIAKDLQAAATKLEDGLAVFDNYDAPIEWVMVGGDFVADKLRPLLAELVDCAENWKTPKRVHISRPSETSAARTFFMRTLSQGFKRRYGQALNEVTLEFTKFFFPETTLDVAGVSRRLTPKRRSQKAAPQGSH